MTAIETTKSWQPAVELDLETASATAFQDALAKFSEWSTGAPPLEPLALTNGWHQVTPEMAEDLLRRNQRNRKVGLATVKKYWRAMKAGEWKPTGQPVLLNQDGKLEDSQHRLWASYLGKVAFPTFVVTDVPVAPDLFAYIDDMKARSAGDALYAAGENGLSPTIANAVRIAWRYENHALAIIKEPRLLELRIPEMLEYARAHPELISAAHVLAGNYHRSAAVIGNKGVAAFFVWKAIEHHNVDVLDEFMLALGTGANLNEDSPILGLRRRLLETKEELSKSHRLALLIKAFLIFAAGEKIAPRRGLYVRDNEAFPRMEPLGELENAA